jgi:hypothetical protein
MPENISSINVLPSLQDGNDAVYAKVVNSSNVNGYLTAKDSSSFVLPTLSCAENKKQLLYYGIGTNFYNQGGYHQVL